MLLGQKHTFLSETQPEDPRVWLREGRWSPAENVTSASLPHWSAVHVAEHSSEPMGLLAGNLSLVGTQHGPPDRLSPCHSLARNNGRQSTERKLHKLRTP